MVDESNPKILGFVNKIKELLNSKADENHKHGNITNAGAIGTAANKPLITGTNGVVQVGSFGTAANTFCQGNDSRLSNARTPTKHDSTATTYGVGTGSNYGHNKIIDDASKSSLVDGESLSAHMGYILNNQDIEYVVGTHGTTATNVWTGTCTKLRKLETGSKIYFRMTSAGTSTAATLNLTLADGTSTGAKKVYYNNSTTLTTHFPVNTVLPLVYDGTKWITALIQNVNNIDRLSSSHILAGEALAKNVIVHGKSDKKYYVLESGAIIDTRYSILWTGAAISSGANSNNVYSAYPSVNIQTTVSGKTVTAYEQVYIEGTAFNKGQFTVSSNVFVSDSGLSDGKYYIPIGHSYSTTNIRFNIVDRIVFKYTTANGLIPVVYDYIDNIIGDINDYITS